MKFRFLNNTLQNKRFHYNSRYYDERKEALDQKKEYYRKMSNGELSDDDRRSMFRANLNSELSRGEYRQSQNRSANIRVLVLIVVLLALGYFIFNGVSEVDTIVNNLW
ncbi:MAG: hypothetical protein HWE22_05385 [Flavobacteriales bacterium]|nr:hypothetical protein [Flavobacteriales bacterium]PIE87235.1 MAG: hypothetical protein CSA03_01355 [Bacteroidota bacterium]